MVYKVVYNDCYGGYSLSREAILLGRKISGDPTWGGVCIIGDTYENGDPVAYDYGYVYELPRHDPILIQVVEELGEKASGSCAKLRIQTVSSLYRIEEYDGHETVYTPDDLHDWVDPREDNNNDS